MNAILTITQPDGHVFEYGAVPNRVHSIGRAKDNDIVLNDRRVSRKHAYIDGSGGIFVLHDGHVENGQPVRSVNHVFVNGTPRLEAELKTGDTITIGETQIAVRLFSAGAADANDRSAAPISAGIRYDDAPFGHTMMEMTANEIIGKRSNISVDNGVATPDEIKDLRRKARSLELLYEMSRTLGRVFDLQEICNIATDLVFRGTPADRAIALLADETPDGRILDFSLYQIAAKTRDARIEKLTSDLTVSRTITEKVMRDKVAILSQDAVSDAQFHGAASIVSQGVRSTICAPLITESNVHGVIYADRLDPFATFTQDHLEMISAVAAQAAITIETIRAHDRLAREEVARANYGRFMPEYVVRQLLDDPSSFRLGGIDQTITVLFADIRGFTSISEHEDPERVVALLNRYFSAMTEIIFAHGGTLDKYIGDGLMALFGAPTASPADAANALKAAVAMQKAIPRLNAELAPEGYPSIRVGIGLHTGVATVGYIGSDRRSEYTAIGDTVNLASRLESSAAGGEILLTDATAKAAGGIFPLKRREPLLVKNRTAPVELFELGIV